MKVMTFSKQFPGYHPRAGEPTHFVQKILHSLIIPNFKPLTEIGNPPKFHTIRAGERWKVGDKFSARIWTGKPYRSKQEEFAQLEVKWVLPVEMKQMEDHRFYVTTPSKIKGMDSLLSIGEVAKNDGLEYYDFISWFNKLPFTGQIICWNDKIEY